MPKAREPRAGAGPNRPMPAASRRGPALRTGGCAVVLEREGTAAVVCASVPL